MEDSQDYFKAMLMQSLVQSASSGVTQAFSGLGDMAMYFLMQSINAHKFNKEDKKEKARLEAERQKAEAEARRRAEQQEAKERAIRQRLEFQKNEKELMIKTLKQLVSLNNSHGKGPIIRDNPLIDSIVKEESYDDDQQRKIERIYALDGKDPKNFINIGDKSIDISKLSPLIKKIKTPELQKEFIPEDQIEFFNKLSPTQKTKFLVSSLFDLDKTSGNTIDLKKVVNKISRVEENPEYEKLTKKFNEYIANEIGENADHYDAKFVSGLFDEYKKAHTKKLYQNIYDDLTPVVDGQKSLEKLQNIYFSNKFKNEVRIPIEKLKLQAKTDYVNKLNKLKITKDKNTGLPIIDKDLTTKIASLSKEATSKLFASTKEITQRFERSFDEDAKGFTNEPDENFVKKIITNIFPNSKEIFNGFENQLASDFKNVLKNSKQDLQFLGHDLAKSVVQSSDFDNISIKPSKHFEVEDFDTKAGISNLFEKNFYSEKPEYYNSNGKPGSVYKTKNYDYYTPPDSADMRLYVGHENFAQDLNKAQLDFFNSYDPHQERFGALKFVDKHPAYKQDQIKYDDNPVLVENFAKKQNFNQSIKEYNALIRKPNLKPTDYVEIEKKRKELEDQLRFAQFDTIGKNNTSAGKFYPYQTGNDTRIISQISGGSDPYDLFDTQRYEPIEYSKLNTDSFVEYNNKIKQERENEQRLEEKRKYDYETKPVTWLTKKTQKELDAAEQTKKLQASAKAKSKQLKNKLGIVALQRNNLELSNQISQIEQNQLKFDDDVKILMNRDPNFAKNIGNIVKANLGVE